MAGFPIGGCVVRFLPEGICWLCLFCCGLIVVVVVINSGAVVASLFVGV